MDGKIYIFTGAGASADSGIDTFRGVQGLWNNHKISEICTYSTWERNAAKVHEFYSDRREELYKKDSNQQRLIKPNKIHHIIDSWQRDFNAAIITTNVDDLHESAGSDCTHLHGFLDNMECVQCGHIWRVNGQRTSYKDIKCPTCSSVRVKPGVVFFEESAPEYKKLHAVFSSLTPDDITITIGCSNVVIPFDIYLDKKPSINIWCNIDRHNDYQAPDNVFSHQMIGKAAECADDIDFLVRKLMK